MSMVYIVSPHVQLSLMCDVSGVALYNPYDGNTSFIRSATGQNLHALMENRGLSLSQFAQMCGLTLPAAQSELDKWVRQNVISEETA